MAEVNPGGDPELRAALVDGFAGAVEWIRSLGVECRDAVPVLRYGRGHQFDTGQYLGLCERIVRDRGEVLTEADTTELLARSVVTGRSSARRRGTEPAELAADGASAARSAPCARARRCSPPAGSRPIPPCGPS